MCQFLDFLNILLFFKIFKFFLIFLKTIKNLSRVKLTSCHVVVIVPRVTIMPDVIFSFSIWSLYFNFCLNLVLIFVKIVQFRRSPN